MTRASIASVAFPAFAADSSAPRPETGIAVDAVAVTQHARGRQLLAPVSVSIAPGELVAIAGGSGAGKTTLLRVIAGLQRPSSGSVSHDGIALASWPEPAGAVGYVPQEDIIHGDLPLGRTLTYAARLRLPNASGDEIRRLVRETLTRLSLSDREQVAVKNLSGGQRKRASIAVELLAKPGLFVLDEPTSGLDPATGAEVMQILRELAASGMTIVITTHSPDDLMDCARVLFLDRGGALVFDGRPTDALHHFRVDRLAKVYGAIARPARVATWAPGGTRPAAARRANAARRRENNSSRSVAVAARQFRTLARREFDLLLRNRLTLAIILGSPVLVTMMMTILFKPGSGTGAAPMQSVNLAFWLAFDGFFFGLTYGLLQIATEYSIFARERRSGLSVFAYVAGKIGVLTPVLLAIDVMLLGVLRVTDRLPAAGINVYGPIGVVFLLDALAGLGFGLLASALVRNPSQAALALPMICFPQVLFAGAIVPVPLMARPGEWISFGMATRWGFESFTRILHLGDSSGPGGATMSDYASAVHGSSLQGAMALLALAVMLATAAIVVLRQRSKSA